MSMAAPALAMPADRIADRDTILVGASVRRAALYALGAKRDPPDLCGGSRRGECSGARVGVPSTVRLEFARQSPARAP